MANELTRTKALYVITNEERGVVGVYTAKARAQEAARADSGDVINVIPVGLLDEPLTATEYTPPTAPVLQYGLADGFDATEYVPMPELEPQLVQNGMDIEDYYTQTEEAPPVVPKVLTAKDLILARLARDLGVEDENTDEDPAAPVQPSAPSGGTAVFREGGTGPGSTAASVEYFSPI